MASGTPAPADSQQNTSTPLAGGSLSSPACSLQYSAKDTSTVGNVGADPLLDQQWHLRNTGQSGGTAGEDLNVAGAWNSTLGAGVRVAVVDNALETVHRDLVANIEPKASYSYRPEQQGYPEPLPCFSGESHGTSVAGIIAARSNNTTGGSGVAPAAKLVGYNALATNTDADLADALNRDLALNAVYNNSWGSPDDATLNTVSGLHDMALERGIQQGRAGLGALYVFAAGNGGCVRVIGDSQTCQNDNSNYDGYLTHMGAIVVGAVDRFGRAPRYAESGANLLINAPGGDSSVGVTTTTLADGYTQSFIGTSAATPMASGAIALMLAANPSLTWRDVRILLARTARRNDPLHPSWQMASNPVPGQPAAFSHRYGFGTIDASAAVAAARSWQTVGGSAQLKRCGPFDLSSQAAIPDTGADLRELLAINTGQCDIRAIEHIELVLDIDHEYSGDLSIRLISPAGNLSELAGTRRCVNTLRDSDHCGAYNNWRFGSVRHLDESPVGNWTLTISDGAAGKTGVLRGWSLRIYGR